MIIRSCVTEKNLNWMCGKFRFQGDEISGKVELKSSANINSIYLSIFRYHLNYIFGLLSIGCMLTCNEDFCNGASVLSDSGMDALLLTVSLCMAATHIVVSIMYGFDPFEVYVY